MTQIDETFALRPFNYLACLGDGSESHGQPGEAYRCGDGGWRLDLAHWFPCH